ncbi:MAG: hypothetical protein V2A78_07435 [bacterium]
MNKLKNYGLSLTLIFLVCLTVLLSISRAQAANRLLTQVRIMNYSGKGTMVYTENGRTMNLDLKLSPVSSLSFDAYYKTGRRLSDRFHFSCFGIGSQPVSANPNGSVAPISSTATLALSGNLNGNFQMSFAELGYEKSLFNKPGSYRAGAYLGILYGTISMDGLNTSASGVSGTIGNTSFTDGSFSLHDLGKAWYRGPVPNIYVFLDKYFGPNQSWVGSFKVIGTPEVGDDHGRVSSMNYEFDLFYNRKRWEVGLSYLYRDLNIKYSDVPNSKAGNMKFQYYGFGLSLGYKF